MFHPEILAALEQDRQNTMVAEAAAARRARQARQARETRRYRRVAGSPEVRRVVPVVAQLRDMCARLARPGSNPVPLIEALTRTGLRLAGLPSSSGPHKPASVAAREKGSEA